MRSAVRKEHSAGWAGGVASAIAFGLTPVIAVFGYQAGIAPSALVALRGLCGGALLLLCAAAIGQFTKLPLKPCLALAAISGPLFGTQLLFYFTAVEQTGVQTSIVLVHIYPLFVIGLVRLTTRRAIGRPVLGLAVALSLGVALVSGGANGGTTSMTGIALALASAIGYAIYIIVSARWASQVPAVLAGGLVTAGSAATAGAIAFLGGSTLAVSPQGWAIAAAQGLMIVPIGIVGALLAMKHLGPVPASFLGLLEPVVGVLTATVVLHENLEPTQWIGIVVVILASTALPYCQSIVSNDGRILKASVETPQPPSI